MRILVTGSRNWPDDGTVESTLTTTILADGKLPVDTVMVIHGDCPTGADFYARRYVENLKAVGRPIDQDAHPADWATHSKAAGGIRNTEMVELGADICLAFIAPCRKPEHNHTNFVVSHGTADCMKKAQAAAIPVVMVINKDA